MAHLSSSAIFSPSIARQQLAASKDWNYIDTWLASKFASKTPPFERTPETLKALLALAALNESSDEECTLLSRLEAKALADLEVLEENNPNAALIEDLEQNLTREGHTALEALAHLSVETNLPIPDVEKLGKRLIELQITSNNLAQAGDRVSILETHLSKELERLSVLVTDLQSDAYQPSADLTKQTTDYQRKTKALAAKLPELRDRVASLAATLGSSKITAQDAEKEEERYKEMMATVKELEMQVKSYHGLPQDTDLARLELESVRVELRDLTRQRDRMFEGLVERESPQKTRF